MPAILIINEVPPADLLSALDSDAREKNVTLNDAAGLVLGARYGKEWTLTGSPYRPVARFKFRVPPALHKAIRRDAYRDRHTMRGIVFNILADHYGLEPIDPHRRPRSAA